MKGISKLGIFWEKIIRFGLNKENDIKTVHFLVSEMRHYLTFRICVIG